MDRDVKTGHGRRVLFHNLFAHEKTPWEEIVSNFEVNADRLARRKNGNALYHEILSFSTGYRLKEDELVRAIADVGQEYLDQRAPDQLAYGVVHLDKDHAHLHLCISANRADAPDRVRLAKADFAKVQQRVEALVLERYPELEQRQIYARERQAERIKSRRSEQDMRRHRGVASDKEQLTHRLHAIFELAQSGDELVALLKQDGYTLYQRGKTIGVREIGEEGRRYRLNTLGALEHYQAAKARIETLDQERGAAAKGQKHGQDTAREPGGPEARTKGQSPDSGPAKAHSGPDQPASPYRHKPEPERFRRTEEEPDMGFKEWFNRHKDQPEKEPAFYAQVVKMFLTGELPKQSAPKYEPEKKQSVITETIYEFLTGDVRSATPSDQAKADKSATIKQMIADEVARQMRAQQQQEPPKRSRAEEEIDRVRAEADRLRQARADSREKAQESSKADQRKADLDATVDRNQGKEPDRDR